MKKASIALIVLVLLFGCFCAGFFIGRNFNHSPVTIATDHTTKPTEPLPSATEPSESPYPINLNTATVQDLTLLPGVGEVLAQRIIAYREANGPFKSVADLVNVDGIGDKKLESILDYITVGGS